jgi:hypothetical protein
MRLMLPILAGLLASVFIVPVAHPAVGLRAHGGYGQTSMSDFNESMDVIRSNLLEHGFPAPEKLSGGWSFGADFLITLGSRSVLVLSYDQSKESIWWGSAPEGRYSFQSTKVLNRCLSGGLHFFYDERWPAYLIAKTGLTQGQVDHEIYASRSSEGIRIESGYQIVRWAPVFEAGIGGLMRFSSHPHTGLFVEATYRYRKVPTKAVDLDFSGFTATFGMSIGL